MKKDQFDCLVFTGENSCLKIAGLETIRFMLDVIYSAKEISRIVIIGKSEELFFLKNFYKDKELIFLEGKGEVIDDFLSAYFFLKPKQQLLICDANIPLISINSVSEFFKKCWPYKKDFYYPIIPKEKSIKPFFRKGGRYLFLREGIFVGGNLFLVNPKKLKKLIEKKSFPKNYFQLFFIFGLKFGIKFFLKCLVGMTKIKDVEREFEKSGINLKIIVLNSGGVEFSIKRTEDIDIARKILGGYRQK